MPERAPGAWETSAGGPFLTLERERGTVEVWSFGERRFIVKVGEHEREVVGFDEARDAAHALARGLGQRRFAPV